MNALPHADALRPHGIQLQRVLNLNDRPITDGHYVIYWMQASQRERFNHALEYAAICANSWKIPLVVLFALTPSYPGANLRHYAFMLQGLKDVQAACCKRDINFILRIGEPKNEILKAAKKAAAVVADRGYTRVQKDWRSSVAQNLNVRMVQVETDIVVPVEEASQKEEYSARTLRGKISKILPDYLVPVKRVRLQKNSLDTAIKGEDAVEPEALLKKLKPDSTVIASPYFEGGELQAMRRLTGFIKSGLSGYDIDRNDPCLGGTSLLSPYLHFGNISPLDIALKILKQPESESRDAFIEQLIVRRELAINFVFYNERYDEYKALPEWARQTLSVHAKDKRDDVYSLQELEQAKTHDMAWNAAQMQMVNTGYMHNYMRMYWGKKVLEWSRKPEDAFDILLYLNDKYELDGRDPNGYAGVAWCFGKHDRPWPQRSIFGTVRYMNANGLKRKFDVDEYIKNVAKL